MRYTVVAVGRIRTAALRTVCDEYLGRLRHYAKIEEREVRDEARLSAAIDGATRLVALSRVGEPWTSSELAQRTARWDREGREVAFAIGGADGLPRALLERAETTWSLSAMTFPHELARVLVLEQLYRAFTIRRGEPYHRGG